MNSGVKAVNLELLTVESEIDKLRTSALHEIANIGIGHAASSLSLLVNRDFKISVPSVFPVEFEMITELLPNDGGDYAVVYMAISGDLTGRMAFFMDWPSCQSLLELLIGEAPASADEMTELEYSSILETGNIINGAFLSAFNEFTGVVGLATPPLLAVDQLDAIVNSITSEAMQDHIALFVETKIWDHSKAVTGSFLFIPTQSSLNLLWQKFCLTGAA